MYTQFDNLNDDIDFTTEYYVGHETKCAGFTMTMVHAFQGNHTEIQKKFDTFKKLQESTLIDHVVNQQNDLGWTPLMLACRNINNSGNVETIRLLLENGADVNKQNHVGCTALTIASICTKNDSHIDTIKLLLKYGADVNLKKTSDGSTTLMGLMKVHRSVSNIGIVRLLLDNGADANCVDFNGNSPLMTACKSAIGNSNDKVIELLFEYGADMHITNSKGKAAFMIAFKENKLSVLKILLRNVENILLVINDKITVKDLISLLRRI